MVEPTVTDLFPEMEMKLLGLALAALLLNGCGMFDRFWDEEILGVYAPETLRNKQRTNFIQTLNSYLEKSKAERVRIVRPPDKCTNQSSAVEICEWKWVSTSVEHSVVYAYGSGGLATSWSYRGFYGQFTSTNYAEVEAGSTVKSQTETVLSREGSWTHPVKTDQQFKQDDMQCKIEVQIYPKGVWDTEIEKCLKRNGWVQREKR